MAKNCPIKQVNDDDWNANVEVNLATNIDLDRTAAILSGLKEGRSVDEIIEGFGTGTSG